MASSCLPRCRPIRRNCAADGLAPGQDRLLPADRVGKPAELLDRFARAGVDPGVGHKLGDAPRSDVQLAAATGQFLGPLRPIAAGAGQSGRVAAPTASDRLGANFRGKPDLEQHFAASAAAPR